MKPLTPTCKTLYCVLCLLWHPFDCTAHSWPNVAPSGTATQSSVDQNGFPQRAIDGNRNPNYGRGSSCTHTLAGAFTNWWSLQLPAEYIIEEIIIGNRRELHERINNAEILIGNSLENNGNNNPRCAVIPFIPSASIRTFKCGMIGSVVNIRLNVAPLRTALTLCEVEVYGEPAPPSFTFQAMSRNIIVVKRKLCWSDALFYCRDYYSDLVSINDVNERAELESHLRTILGNASSPLTKHVWLGLRRQLRWNTWIWMSGGHLQHTHWKDEDPWQITSLCGGMATNEPFYWTNLPCGDHLYFICFKDDQPHTNRVQFYSSRRPRG